MTFRIKPIKPGVRRTKYVTFYVPEELYYQALAHAASNKVSIQEFAKQAMEQAVTDLERQRLSTPMGEVK